MVFAQERPQYDGTRAIRELHEGWLVVRLPGFEKKIAVLDSLLADKTLSDKGRANLETELRYTIEEREMIHAYYPVLFDSVYTFSNCAFIYTHETEDFQSGLIPARNAAGEPVDGLHRANYVFATLQGAVGKPFVFTSKDHKIINYPFPNNIGKPGGIATTLFLPDTPEVHAAEKYGEAPLRRAYGHVYRVNRKLYAFHRRQFN